MSEPTFPEALAAAIAEGQAARAEAKRIHDAGEAHHTESCWWCHDEAMRKAFADFATEVAGILKPLLDALREGLKAAAEEEPTARTYGPPQRRQRAPRDHRSSTGLAARSTSTRQSQRNALRRL